MYSFIINIINVNFKMLIILIIMMSISFEYYCCRSFSYVIMELRRPKALWLDTVSFTG